MAFYCLLPVYSSSTCLSSTLRRSRVSRPALLHLEKGIAQGAAVNAQVVGQLLTVKGQVELHTAAAPRQHRKNTP